MWFFSTILICTCLHVSFVRAIISCLSTFSLFVQHICFMPTKKKFCTTTSQSSETICEENLWVSEFIFTKSGSINDIMVKELSTECWSLQISQWDNWLTGWSIIACIFDEENLYYIQIMGQNVQMYHQEIKLSNKERLQVGKKLILLWILWSINLLLTKIDFIRMMGVTR